MWHTVPPKCAAAHHWTTSNGPPSSGRCGPLLPTPLPSRPRRGPGRARDPVGPPPVRAECLNVPQRPATLRARDLGRHRRRGRCEAGRTIGGLPISKGHAVQAAHVRHDPGAATYTRAALGTRNLPALGRRRVPGALVPPRRARCPAVGGEERVRRNQHLRTTRAGVHDVTCRLTPRALYRHLPRVTRRPSAVVR